MRCLNEIANIPGAGMVIFCAAYWVVVRIGHRLTGYWEGFCFESNGVIGCALKRQVAKVGHMDGLA